MILLDINVVSELMRRTPEPAVVAWLDAQEASAVYISVITEAELRYGVATLPEGRRRTRLSAELDKTLEEELGRRVLPFDRAAARSFAAIGAARRAAGMPISHPDCQIAAIARQSGRSRCNPESRRFRALRDRGGQPRGRPPWIGSRYRDERHQRLLVAREPLPAVRFDHTP